MEIEGYSGWGLWLILAVLAFNLACIPMWFLVNHLRRTHEFRLKEVRTFLDLLAMERSSDNTPDGRLDESVSLIESQLDEAEGLGPLWGRKSVELARLGRYQVEHQYPELCDTIRERMLRKRPGSSS